MKKYTAGKRVPEKKISVPSSPGKRSQRSAKVPYRLVELNSETDQVPPAQEQGPAEAHISERQALQAVQAVIEMQRQEDLAIFYAGVERAFRSRDIRKVNAALTDTFRQTHFGDRDSNVQLDVPSHTLVIESPSGVQSISLDRTLDARAAILQLGKQIFAPRLYHEVNFTDLQQSEAARQSLLTYFQTRMSDRLDTCRKRKQVRTADSFGHPANAMELQGIQ